MVKTEPKVLLAGEGNPCALHLRALLALTAPKLSGSPGDIVNEIRINLSDPCSARQKHTEGIIR